MDNIPVEIKLRILNLMPLAVIKEVTLVSKELSMGTVSVNQLLEMSETQNKPQKCRNNG